MLKAQLHIGQARFMIRSMDYRNEFFQKDGTYGKKTKKNKKKNQKINVF